APGQKWNPENKVRFVAPPVVRQRPGTIWVLGPDHKPQSRKVVLGLSDGASTEAVSGDLKEGDLIIVGDSSQADGGGNRGNQQGGIRIGLPGLGGGGGGRRF